MKEKEEMYTIFYEQKKFAKNMCNREQNSYLQNNSAQQRQKCSERKNREKIDKTFKTMNIKYNVDSLIRGLDVMCWPQENVK